MSPQTKYQIIFDNNPRALFYSGQSISGTLIITTSVPRVLLSITLSFVSKGRTTFVAGIYYDCQNIILYDRSLTLLDTNERENWPPGEHKFRFKDQLAKDVTPTFYGKRGFILHEIIVKVNGGSCHDNIAKIPFTVMQSDDVFLRQKSLLTQNPRKLSQTINVCYCCFLIRQPYKIVVKASSNVLRPGDAFSVFIITVSKKMEKIYSIKMSLIKRLEYIFKSNKKTEEIIIASCRTKDSDQFEAEKFSVALRIPPTEPTTFRYNKLVILSYYVKLNVTLLTFCDEPLKLKIPVTIGVGNVDFENEIYATKQGFNIPLKAPVAALDDSLRDINKIPEIGFIPYSNHNAYNPPAIATSQYAWFTKTHVSKSSDNFPAVNPPYPIKMYSDSCLQTNQMPKYGFSENVLPPSKQLVPSQFAEQSIITSQQRKQPMLGFSEAVYPPGHFQNNSPNLHRKFNDFTPILNPSECANKSASASRPYPVDIGFTPQVIKGNTVRGTYNKFAMIPQVGAIGTTPPI